MFRQHNIFRLIPVSMPLLSLFLLLAMMTGLFVNTALEQERMRRFGRALYSDNAVFFRFEAGSGSGSTAVTPAALLTVPDGGDYWVVAAMEEIRAVFRNGNPEPFPLISGTLPDEAMSRAPDPVAVVGIDRSDLLDPDAPDRVRLLGQTYTVVGRMGTGYASTLNQLVLVNMGSVPAEQLLNARFHIDGDDPERVLAGIRHNATSMDIPVPIALDPPLSPLDVLLPHRHISWIYMGLLIAVVMLSCAILLVSGIRSRRYAIAVYRLVGYRGSAAAGRVLIRYAVPAAVGIALAIGIQAGLVRAGLLYEGIGLGWQSAAVAGCSFGIGLGVSLPALLSAARSDIVKVLR